MQFQSDPRRCVLIIDDDPAFTLLASETLRAGGFDARGASNSREALASFESRDPGPGAARRRIAGQQRLRPVRDAAPDEPGIDVPIVMVTGHDDTASIAQAYQVGATDFIHKPVLWPTLPHRVGFILRARDNMRALQASEHKNRALLQALPDTIYIVDRRRRAPGAHHRRRQAQSAPALIGKTAGRACCRPAWRSAARLAASGASPAASLTHLRI